MTDEIPLFADKAKFADYIEKTVLERKINHVDAILEYCSTHYIDPEDIVKLLNKPLLNKVKADFIESNHIKVQPLTKFFES
jgi:hypothetical protein